MKISIEYCSIWNYLPKASSLESELEQIYPDAEIKLGHKGDYNFNPGDDFTVMFWANVSQSVTQTSYLVSKSTTKEAIPGTFPKLITLLLNLIMYHMKLKLNHNIHLKYLLLEIKFSLKDPMEIYLLL